MRQYNPNNERIKCRYFRDLKEADCKGVSTIKASREALYKYDKLFNFEDITRFDQDKAIAFKNHLRETPSRTTGEAISRTYLWHATRYVKDFFVWLSEDPKYRTKIKKNDIKYFNLNPEDKAIALATSEREYASVDEINSVIKSMPFDSEVEKRNKALLCLLLLTGARISALISLKIKHINIQKRFVIQHPKEVKTKNRKLIKTWFFPVGTYSFEVIVDYMRFLGQKGFGSNDPLFPRNDQTLPPLSSSHLGVSQWKSTSSARKIITGYFVKNGLPAFCPHSFRNSLTQLAYKCCRTPEDFKAWSVNLGHSSTLTTFTSYGHIDEGRQGDIILGFSQ